MVATSQLPPLILHPFSAGGSADELLAGSKASLALQGFESTAFGNTASGNTAQDDAVNDEAELFRRVLVGRYQEIRMLLFLGKDLFRWMQQCVDFAERSGAGDPRISEQCFAAFVVEDPPAAVQAKLQKWGVCDRRAIFSRAIGINSLFHTPPPFETLSSMFLQNYHRYADHAYICFQHLKPFHTFPAGQYDFQMYASEEYAKLLSEQWERV